MSDKSKKSLVDTGWSQMNQVLDKELPQKKKKRPVAWIFAGVAVLFAALWLFFTLIDRNEPVTTSSLDQVAVDVVTSERISTEQATISSLGSEALDQKSTKDLKPSAKSDANNKLLIENQSKGQINTESKVSRKSKASTEVKTIRVNEKEIISLINTKSARRDQHLDSQSVAANFRGSDNKKVEVIENARLIERLLGKEEMYEDITVENQNANLTDNSNSTIEKLNASGGAIRSSDKTRTLFTFPYLSTRSAFSGERLYPNMAGLQLTTPQIFSPKIDQASVFSGYIAVGTRAQLDAKGVGLSAGVGLEYRASDWSIRSEVGLGRVRYLGRQDEINFSISVDTSLSGVTAVDIPEADLNSFEADRDLDFSNRLTAKQLLLQMDYAYTRLDVSRMLNNRVSISVGASLLRFFRISNQAYSLANELQEFSSEYQSYDVASNELQSTGAIRRYEFGVDLGAAYRISRNLTLELRYHHGITDLAHQGEEASDIAANESFEQNLSAKITNSPFKRKSIDIRILYRF